jgi:transcription elongation factor GreA
MIEELKQKLGDEVEKLQHELNVTLPNEIRRAVEMGDLRENSEYKAALERQQLVRARLSQLRERLSKLSSIDVTQIPSDKVGLGSRVTVEDQATKKKENFELVFGDSVEFDEKQVSMSSPIGKALVGKCVGEIAILKLPTLTRRLKVLELKTIHDSVTAD